jgi:hypothetical protein
MNMLQSVLRARFSQMKGVPRRIKTSILGVSAITVALLAPLSQPASAQAVVIVPPGCGSYSGLPLPAGWSLDDHSASAVPLGNIFGAPFIVPAVFGRITVGTQFADHIQGNNGNNDVICGLDGDDWIKGGAGDDQLFGGAGFDVLWGEANSDLLSGGDDDDDLYGDDPANSNLFDTFDTLQGGEGDDRLLGGRGFDILRGGPHVVGDCGDGEAGGASHAGLESGPPC